MTEFEKASAEMKRAAVNEFKKEITDQIKLIFADEFPEPSGATERLYETVLEIIEKA